MEYLHVKFSTRKYAGNDSFTKALMFKIHEREVILHFESMDLLL